MVLYKLDVKKVRINWVTEIHHSKEGRINNAFTQGQHKQTLIPIIGASRRVLDFKVISSKIDNIPQHEDFWVAFNQHKIRVTDQDFTTKLRTLLKGEECPVLRFVKSRRATAGKGREIKCFGKIKEKTVSQFVYEGKVVC